MLCKHNQHPFLEAPEGFHNFLLLFLAHTAKNMKWLRKAENKEKLKSLLKVKEESDKAGLKPQI